MKKNRLFAALAASALTLSLLAGCGTSEKPTDNVAPDTNTPSTGTTTPGETAPEDAQTPAPGDSSIGDLISVVGLPDGELRAQLGDGTASVSPDDVLIAREYTRDILGENVPVSVTFDDAEKVSGVSIIFSSTTFDDASTKLTAAYGEATEHQKSEESGGQNSVWQLEGSTLTLIEAYGTVSLMITA